MYLLGSPFPLLPRLFSPIFAYASYTTPPPLLPPATLDTKALLIPPLQNSAWAPPLLPCLHVNYLTNISDSELFTNRPNNFLLLTSLPSNAWKDAPD